MPSIFGDLFTLPATGVIVQASPGALTRIAEVVQEMDLLQQYIHQAGALEQLTQRRVEPLTFFSVLPEFNYVTGYLSRSSLEALVSNANIERIWKDGTMSILQTEPAVVPSQGIYTIRVQNKTATFTSTDWTRRLMGADVANTKGYNGADILVTVVDTGGIRYHPQTTRLIKKSAMYYQIEDENGHGEWCLTEESYVWTSFCGLEKIGALFNRLGLENQVTQREGGESIDLSGKGVYTYSWDGQKFVRTKILAAHRKLAADDVIEIKAGGVNLRLTGNHVCFTWHDGILVEKAAKDIVVGDNLVQPSHVYYEEGYVMKNGIRIDEHWGYLLGFIVGDGHGRTDTRTYLAKGTKEEIENVTKSVEASGFHMTSIRPESGADCSVLSFGSEFYDAVRLLLKFPVGTKTRVIAVPEVVKKSPRTVVGAFLAGLLDSDGSFSNGQAEIDSSSVDLVREVAGLLALMGIKTTVQLREPTNRVTVQGYEDVLKLFHLVLAFSVKAAKMRQYISHVDIARSHPRAVIDHELRLLPVTHIESRGRYNGPFYDLTTERGNYLGGTLGLALVHNCASCVGGVRAKDYWNSERAGQGIYCEGMAPGARLEEIKALGYLIGTGSNSGLLRGLAMAMADKSDVVSCSWGGSSATSTPQDDPFYMAYNTMTTAGIVVATAAGNSGPNPKTVDSPGAMPDALTVGAFSPFDTSYGAAGTMASFSSRGPTNWGDIKPDCIAPGVLIDSGITGVLDLDGDYRKNDYSPISGTSMATPHVAGLVALAKQVYKAKGLPNLTTGEVKSMLSSLGANQPKDNNQGWGRLTWSMFERWLSTQHGITI